MNGPLPAVSHAASFTTALSRWYPKAGPSRPFRSKSDNELTLLRTPLG